MAADTILATRVFEHSRKSLLRDPASVEDLDEDGEQPRVDAIHAHVVIIVVVVIVPPLKQRLLLDCLSCVIRSPPF